MKTMHHLSQSIVGPLLNWKKKDWEAATKWIHKCDGSDYTAEELHQEFLAEYGKGHECVPIGECDNFDYKTGCKGHPLTVEQKLADLRSSLKETTARN